MSRCWVHIMCACLNCNLLMKQYIIDIVHCFDLSRIVCAALGHTNPIHCSWQTPALYIIENCASPFSASISSYSDAWKIAACTIISYHQCNIFRNAPLGRSTSLLLPWWFYFIGWWKRCNNSTALEKVKSWKPRVRVAGINKRLKIYWYLLNI